MSVQIRRAGVTLPHGVSLFYFLLYPHALKGFAAVAHLVDKLPGLVVYLGKALVALGVDLTALFNRALAPFAFGTVLCHML